MSDYNTIFELSFHSNTIPDFYNYDCSKSNSRTDFYTPQFKVIYHNDKEYSVPKYFSLNSYSRIINDANKLVF